MADNASIGFSMEFDISDSPTGVLTLTHTNLDASNQGQTGISFVIQRQASGGVTLLQMQNYLGIGKSISGGYR